MTFEDYRRLAAQHPRIGDLLSEPPGVEDIEFEVPPSRDRPRPAAFD